MKIKTCNCKKEITTKNVIALEDYMMSSDRMLKLGNCPKCGTTIVIGKRFFNDNVTRNYKKAVNQ